MTNYAYRLTATVFMILAIMSTVFYSLSLKHGLLEDAVVDVTAGLIGLWALAIVTVFISLAEKYQNNDG